MTEYRINSVPWWYITLVIVLLAPLALVPQYIADINATQMVVKKPFIWYYMAYVPVACLLTYLCRRYGRNMVSWILVAIVALTHVAMWVLVYCDI